MGDSRVCVHGSEYEIGAGSKSGSGRGCGYGDGSRSGSGYGYGIGVGYGLGYGLLLGEVRGARDDYDVMVLTPWPYARIGCETHSILYWRAHWREVAEAHDEEIVEEDLMELLDRAQEAVTR